MLGLIDPSEKIENILLGCKMKTKNDTVKLITFSESLNNSTSSTTTKESNYKIMSQIERPKNFCKRNPHIFGGR